MPTPTNPDAPQATRDDLARLVDRFYADVFADAELGPLFAPVAGERWATHRERMVEFWCTALLRTHSFRGNVMRKHVALLPALKPAHFERWLTLWRRHTTATLAPHDAADAFRTAQGIARNLHLGCFGSAPGFIVDASAVRLVGA